MKLNHLLALVNMHIQVFVNFVNLKLIAKMQWKLIAAFRKNQSFRKAGKGNKMSRPEYLNCIMTPEIISRIRADQELYDKDPEAYERRERLAKEEREREEYERNRQ